MNLEKYVQAVDGVQCMTPEGVGILVGLTGAEVVAERDRQEALHPGQFFGPKSWVRRTKELQARHGTDDMALLMTRILAERGGL
jgi:hypothetical protein